VNLPVFPRRILSLTFDTVFAHIGMDTPSLESG
jgi:hypothetical protein